MPVDKLVAQFLARGGQIVRVTRRPSRRLPITWSIPCIAYYDWRS